MAGRIFPLHNGAHFAAGLPITLERSGIGLVLYQLHDVHSDFLLGIFWVEWIGGSWETSVCLLVELELGRYG